MRGRPRAVLLPDAPVFELITRAPRGLQRVREAGLNPSRIRRRGPSLHEADRLADLFHTHPALIWGPDYWRAA